MANYNQMNLQQLRQIGKEMGLLRVDKNKKKDLIERLKKGKQLSDYSKGVLLEQAQNKGILANATMSKETLLQKLRNPKLTDLNEKRLRKIADEKGIALRGKMTKENIITRLKNPTQYYTIEGLKKVAASNNIVVDKNIRKPDLIRILENANLITTTPDTVEEVNLGVRYSDAPLELIRVAKQKARNAREDLINYRNYIKNLKSDLLTSRRLKQMQNTLEKRERRAREEHDRIFQYVESQSALREFAKVYTLQGSDVYDGRTFLNEARNSITGILRRNKQTKVELVFKCNLERDVLDFGTEVRPFRFASRKELNLQSTDEDELYDNMLYRIEEEIQNCENAEGTGWRLHSVICLELHTVEYQPLRGSSYIELPRFIRDKKAVINMKNEDNKCFLWCILRALNPVDKNTERIDKNLKSKIDTLNMEGIEYPVSLRDINKFESLNSNISITVMGYDAQDKIYPLRISKHNDRTHKIKLLLIEDNEKRHYCLIRNLCRLIGTQVSKHNGKCFICENCLNPFVTEESLDKHKEYCDSNECVKINMPKKGDIVKFKNYCNSEKVPFIIYADTEALIKPIQSCTPDSQNSYTKKYQKHEPISFSYYIKCFDDEIYEPVLRSYTGVDAMEKFINSLEEDVKVIANIPKKKMIFNKEEAERFNKENKCWICKEDLDNDKVRDHCHFTGRYRGATHNSCNLKYRKPKFIPVVFHNLSGYDSHLFIKNLGFTAGDINCIPNNEEKYISFTKKIPVGTYPKKAIDADGDIFYEQKPISFNIRFIDSFKFMPVSLDSLVNNLPEESFNNLERYYTGDKLNLVKRKGVYPYEYMDSLERFKENKLPPKESFYSRLTGEDISNEDYEHAKKVWDVFGMKTLQDYHDLYNETDVLLLADVFENFRDICLNNYKLDPAHYFTSPGLFWDACLKMTDVKLELLTDIDMLLMIEKGIRGGISMVSNRYGKSNNKYMRKKFNISGPSKYLQYLDANNLYGAAMSMKLPTHGFKWMNDKELPVWRKIPCILEVDLEYPKELHDLHKDYPLASERVMCKNNVEKLIPTLGNKKKYVLHYKNLSQYLDLGLRLTRIHRGIKFEESEWLKSYIDTNTELRKKAINNFEKNFF